MPPVFLDRKRGEHDSGRAQLRIAPAAEPEKDGSPECKNLYGAGCGQEKREAESHGDQNVAHFGDRLRIARGEEAKYRVPRHDLKHAGAREIGDEAPRRRPRQFADRRKQLIKEKDRANPNEQVTAGQIKSAARLADPRGGCYGKRAQPVPLSDPSGPGRRPMTALMNIAPIPESLQDSFAFTSRASFLQFTGWLRDLPMRRKKLRASMISWTYLLFYAAFSLAEKRPLSNSGLESAGRKPALGAQVLEIIEARNRTISRNCLFSRG